MIKFSASAIQTDRAAEGWSYGVILIDRDTLPLIAGDIVTIRCPANAGPRGLLGAVQLARVKPSVFLVDTARPDRRGCTSDGD